MHAPLPISIPLFGWTKLNFIHSVTQHWEHLRCFIGRRNEWKNNTKENLNAFERVWTPCDALQCSAMSNLNNSLSNSCFHCIISAFFYVLVPYGQLMDDCSALWIHVEYWMASWNFRWIQRRERTTDIWYESFSDESRFKVRHLLFSSLSSVFKVYIFCSSGFLLKTVQKINYTICVFEWFLLYFSFIYTITILKFNVGRPIRNRQTDERCVLAIQLTTFTQIFIY